MRYESHFIINYEYHYNDDIEEEQHLLPFLIKDIQNINYIIFNGNIISDFNVESVENFSSILIKNKVKDGLNSLTVVLSDTKFTVGLVNDTDANISFVNEMFCNDKYKNITINLSYLQCEQFNKNSFLNYTNLISLKTPQNLSYIDDNSFVGCENLSSIIFMTLIAPKLGISVFGYNDTNCVGRNTYSLGINKVYLYHKHSGYENSDWDDILFNKTKCGFSIDSHWSFKKF